MAHKKMPFQYTLRKTAATGTNEIEDDPVDTGRLFCYQRIAVINETTAYTRLRLEARNGGENFLSSEQTTPQADELYWDDVPLYVAEGRRLVAELTGCTASDVLKMYVTGWWIDLDGGQ